MSFTLAVAGKGGVGKTTIASLTVRYLVGTGRKPVLAVDADADAGLNELLGLPLPPGVGQVREEMRKVSGRSKEAFIEARLHEVLAEAQGFDLLAMGRPEGPGCYCAANSLLAKYLEILAGNYPWLVIDNEAGLEHLSRLTVRRPDVMLVVSDPSRRGLRAAARIRDLAREVGIEVKEWRLIVNRVEGGLSPALLEEARGLKMGEPDIVPNDPRVAESEAQGKPMLELPEESAAWLAVKGVLDRLLA